MNTQASKVLHLPTLVGGIAAILVSGIAIASLAISVQSTDGSVAPPEPPEAVIGRAIATPPARAHRCAECGVIESTREIKRSDKKAGVNASGPNAAGGKTLQKPARNYEITIRLNDGSMRVITDINPANWRRGERVTLIAGVE